ncbi:hypothetical protein GV828_02280 [Flavobacterium sp. NST-5]|uniref:histidine kinase n=1 Tax=Flavobacterium ichthyis TaxID=2698827 RepID=A0ABW9Z5A5_9FLAO|nr:sensor histidine kinase [Flavobacterium ichthyis]NBL64023.1 hypothetical protein [Flavobacterium ichthyis]
MPQSILHFCIILLLAFTKVNATSLDIQRDSVNYYLEQSKIYFYNDYKKAENFIRKAEKISNQSSDQLLKADVLYYEATGNYITGFYDIAIAKYLQAFTIYEKENNKKGIAKSLLGQGLVQQGLGHNLEAIELFKKSLTISKGLNDHLMVAKNHFNIGISQSELNQNQDAYKNFQRANAISQKYNFEDIYIMNINRLGNVHSLLGNKDSALYYYQKVITQPETNLWEKSFAMTGMAEVLLEKGNVSEAEQFGVEGYKYAKKLNAKWDIVRSAAILAEIYHQKSNDDLAFNYLKTSLIYKDSLYNEEKVKEINMIQLKKSEVENEQLLLKNESSKQKLNNIRIFSISIILFMLYLLTIIYQHKKNSKQKESLYLELEQKNIDIENQKALISEQNQILSEVNQTKNRLFSIFSHDMKAPIHSIQQVLKMIDEGDISSEELKEIASMLVTQVNGTSTMMNNLLQWSMTQLEGAKTTPENINIVKVINDSLAAFQISANAKEITISLKKPTNVFKIYADKGHVQVILNNLFSNAIKFTPLKGNIEIYFTKDQSLINVHILNSGKGLSDTKVAEILNFDKRMLSEKGTDHEEGTGLGLLLVKQFLIDNNGKFNVSVDAEKGTEFIISFQQAQP